MNTRSEFREITIARKIWLATCVDPVRGLTAPPERKAAIRKAIIDFTLTEQTCLTNESGRDFSFGKCFELAYAEPITPESP